jgi:two-component system cell cycle response regulator
MNQLERELLDLHGLSAVPAYSGTEALSIAGRCHTDAVLLDVMLPEMDGFETCRRLRGMCNHHLPVVMLSALDGDDSRRRGYEAGADAYFSKPFDPDEVILAIRELIVKARNTATRPD